MTRTRDKDERSPERRRETEPGPGATPETRVPMEKSIAGEAGDTQDLSNVEEANEESVEDLAASGQALEASVVDGIEDAADHPERPVHTHDEYGRSDIPPRRRDDAA